MIDIKRRRYVEPVAQKWLEWVCDFFFTVKTGNKQPWLKAVGGGRQNFNTYADKMRFQLENAIRTYARGNGALENRLLAMVRLYMIDFRAVVLASPAQMEALVSIMKQRRMPKHLVSIIKEIMVPYYDAISKEHGHDLVNELNIKTCPYCNRQFIHSFESNRAERPELDHFYPKASYPMFSLSFYNLIPVCHSCNHVKLEDEIGVNPYSKAFGSRFVITDKNGQKVSPSKVYKITEKEMRLRLDGKSAEEAKNSQVLGLENVYNRHTDYVKELIDKSMAYDEHAKRALVESFQGAGHHPRQVYDFVWGKHLMDAEYEDRPLSKLTKDVLDLLGIKRG